MSLSPARAPRLREHLDALLQTLDAGARREQDPVALVWRYDNPDDQALAALIASGLAYGRVALVKRAGEEAMRRLGPCPTQTLLTLSDADLSALYDGFVYRMTQGADIADLLAGVRAQLIAHGSLEAAYLAAPGADHLEKTSAWVRALRQGRLRPQLTRGLRYLLPDPGDGSASKRLHLFFRWVGRGPDAVDPGLWRGLSPAVLRMPLDTHTSRICRYIGLSERQAVDGRAVEEVTASLRLLDPEDPLKYDFAICHLGISGGCIHRRSAPHCAACALDPICTLT